MAQPPEQRRPWRHRVAFFVILLLLLGMAIALPVALGSVVSELTQPAEGDVFALPIAPDASRRPPAAACTSA